MSIKYSYQNEFPPAGLEEILSCLDQNRNELKVILVLSSTVGTWYLSVLNGETPYKGKLQTDFLPKGTYRMTIASDEGSNYKKIVISNRKIKSGKTLQLDLLPGGGYLAKIEKI